MKVIRNSGIYILVALAQAAGSFFLIPIYTAKLDPFDFGIISVVTAINQFGTILVGLSLNGAITRFYYKFKDDPARVRVYWGTAFLISVISSLVFFVVNFLFYRWTLGLLARQIPLLPFGIICLTTACINPIFILCRTSFQARQQGYRFGLINLFYYLTTIAGTLLLVVALRWRAIGYLLAVLGTNILFTAYALVTFLPDIDMVFSRSAAKDLLKYTLPLVPHDVASSLELMVERVVINVALGLSQVGIFNIGSQFGSILILVSAAINQAYTPWFYEKFTDPDGRTLVRRFSVGLVLFYGFTAVVISAFSQEILRFMTRNPAYVDGWIVVPLVAVAALMISLYYIQCNILFQSATHVIPFITVSSCVLGILANMALTPRFGIIGAGVAGIVARGSLLVGVLWTVRWKGFHSVLQARHYQIGILAILCSLGVYIGPLHRSYLLRILLVLGYLGLTTAIAWEELRRFMALIRSHFLKG